MSIIEVKNLCKNYESFKLDNVSFALEKGKITGFIGKNGAGKTTTLKSMLNLVHADSGEISFFGTNFNENELEIKQKIGYVSGGVNFYSHRKLKSITNVTKSFYKNWDEKAYREYLSKFALDENKTPSQLSEGMKVKYSLALALSHNAELLILDEPTSGLDPISRDDLLDVFLDLCDRGVTIFFSTHITSDLDKCADNIVYIQNGRIIANDNLKAFVSGYKAVELTDDELSAADKSLLIGCKRSKEGHTAIIKTENSANIKAKITDADIETIMIHLEKENA